MASTNPLTHRTDREQDKFGHDASQGTYVKTKAIGSVAFSPAGLRTAWRITTMTVGDTQVQLPVASLADRNAMTITNIVDPGYDTAILYIGPTGVAASRALGTSSGHEIMPDEAFNIDVTDDIPVYAVAPTGKTILVKILEVA